MGHTICCSDHDKDSEYEWLREFCERYSSGKEKECNRCHLKNLNGKFIEKFHKIGSNTVKCRHVCEPAMEILCMNSKQNDDLPQSQPIVCLQAARDDELPQRMYYAKAVTASILVLLLFAKTSFLQVVFTQNSDVIAASAVLLLLIYLTTSEKLQHHRCMIRNTLKRIKLEYFNDNQWLFLPTLITTSLAVMCLSSKIVLCIYSRFYYMIPKSKYFYLIDTLSHLVSFDYPEVVEYHDKYFYKLSALNEQKKVKENC